MALDLIPMGKPAPGFEPRFQQIFNILEGIEPQVLSPEEEQAGKQPATREELLREFWGNLIHSCETIRAPRVGTDESANAWVREQYQNSDKERPEAEYIKEHEGMYVIDLAEERDGVPFYGSFFQDRNAFRAEYLRDCVEVLGESLALEAWQTKLAHDALDYGNRLMAVADKIAAERGLLHLKDEYYPPDAEEESVEKQLHVVYSLAKWLIFYGGNGHGYVADY